MNVQVWKSALIDVYVDIDLTEQQPPSRRLSTTFNVKLYCAHYGQYVTALAESVSLKDTRRSGFKRLYILKIYIRVQIY